MEPLRASSKSRVAVLGASGKVGRLIVDELLVRGFDVSCQSRSAERLAPFAPRARVEVFDPCDGPALRRFVAHADAVVFALGIDRLGATTLFSESTRALLEAMQATGVRRLIAITGVGAGATRGHGGFLYDRIVFPLFTRARYQDKERQEALIERSGLDWTIVRPAAYTDRPAEGPLEVHTEVAADLVLTSIGREEVARFVVDEIESGRYRSRFPFIGHR